MGIAAQRNFAREAKAGGLQGTLANEGGKSKGGESCQMAQPLIREPEIQPDEGCTHPLKGRHYL